MIQEFARTLRALLRADIDNYTQDVARGDCKSLDDYRRLCGQIQGLRLAEQHLMDLAKRAETDDD